MRLHHPENFNLELAEKVLHQVTTYPETHSQYSWACGTQACIGGWAVRFDKGNPRLQRRIGEDYGKRARVLLGLTERDARKLFSNRPLSLPEPALGIHRLARWRLASLIRQAQRYPAGQEAIRQREIDREARRQSREIRTQSHREATAVRYSRELEGSSLR